jgi:hypothetical protein
VTRARTRLTGSHRHAHNATMSIAAELRKKNRNEWIC